MEKVLSRGSGARDPRPQWSHIPVAVGVGRSAHLSRRQVMVRACGRISLEPEAEGDFAYPSTVVITSWSRRGVKRSTIYSGSFAGERRQ
jgi:hypothetical protein